jgi:hypothetical protein
MHEDSSRPRGSGSGGLAALGAAALAIGCCVGLPLIVALAGGVAVGALLGVAAGILGAVALGALIALRIRSRRRACEPPAGRDVPAAPRRR